MINWKLFLTILFVLILSSIFFVCFFLSFSFYFRCALSILKGVETALDFLFTFQKSSSAFKISLKALKEQTFYKSS